MPWIVADPEHLCGKARVAGTRISIEFLLETLASGMTIPEVVEEYPNTPVSPRRPSRARWKSSPDRLVPP